jgi:hypothetical protein
MKKRGKVNSNRILFQLSDSSSFIPGKLKFSPLARVTDLSAFGGRAPTGLYCFWFAKRIQKFLTKDYQ